MQRHAVAIRHSGHWRPGTIALSLFCTALLITLEILFFVLPGGQRSAHASIDDPSSPPSIGIGISHPSDSSTDFLFADRFKTWRLQAAPGQTNPPTRDSRGWPQGDFGALLWDGAYLKNNTTGTYTLRFNGKATLAIAGSNATISNQSYDGASNTTTAKIVFTQNGQTPTLQFTATQRTSTSATNTGVTNVQLMSPTSPGASTSYSSTTTFTTPIKNLIAKFSVIRFMDFSATNSNGQINWADRRLPYENQSGPGKNGRTYGWQGLGGAWEYAIRLCNETNRDCYINIPEQATGQRSTETSSYIYKLAQLFKYGSDANGNVYTSTQTSPVNPPLNSNLKLYVEYSNEIWNFAGAFTQSQQNYNAAQAEVATGVSPLNFDGESNTYYLAWRRQGKRIKETSEIFRAVFGDSAMMSRIRPILEWQYGNAQETASQPLQFLNNYYNNGDGLQHVSTPHPVTYYLWGAGGAAYSHVNNPNATTIDGIYNSGLNTSGFSDTIKKDAHWASAFGLRVVAYEGGFTIGGDAPNDIQKQANLDPRAKNAQKTFQQLYSQAGGDLLMYFHATGNNAYGLANPDVFSTTTPKLQGINELSQAAQAAVTNGSAVPVTLNGNNWSICSRGWGTPGSGAVTIGTVADSSGNKPIRWVSYTLHSTGGNRTVKISYSSTTIGSFTLYRGSVVVATVSVPNTGGTTQSTGNYTVTLPSGESALRIHANAGSGNFSITSVSVT